jgi:hypothetical protein
MTNLLGWRQQGALLEGFRPQLNTFIILKIFYKIWAWEFVNMLEVRYDVEVPSIIFSEI